MTTFTEKNHAGEHLLSEANRSLSRETKTILSGSGVIEPGTVLGMVTASSKYVPYDADLANGAQVAAAVCFDRYDATSADVEAVVHFRDCEVSDNNLVWLDVTDKAAGTINLAAKGIIVRDL